MRHVVALRYLVVLTPWVGPGARIEPGPLRLRTVGRLVPAAQSGSAPPRRVLRPMRGGQAYQVASPPERGLVTSGMARALETVLERFAQAHGFTPEQPLQVRLARGFDAGARSHGSGRAIDIAAAAGKSLRESKQEWDHVHVARRRAAGDQGDPECICELPAPADL